MRYIVAFWLTVFFELVFSKLNLKLESIPIKAFLECFLYFQVVIIGFLTAKHRVIEEVSRRVKFPTFVGGFGFLLALLAKRIINHFCGRSLMGINPDVILSMLIVVSLAIFFEGLVNLRLLRSAFEVLGKYSTEMWFFHAAFFTPYTRWLFQPCLVIMKIWPLIYIGCVLGSLIAAMILQESYNAIGSLMKKLRFANG